MKDPSFFLFLESPAGQLWGNVKKVKSETVECHQFNKHVTQNRCYFYLIEAVHDLTADVKMTSGSPTGFFVNQLSTAI